MATGTRRAAVLAALTTKGQTVEQIADATVYTPGIVRPQLQALAEAGLAVAKPSKKTGTAWSLTKTGLATLGPDGATSPAHAARRAGRATHAAAQLAAVKPARKAAAPRTARRVPQAPAPAATPAAAGVAGGMDAVVAFMEDARPVSAAPAPPAPRKRARRDPAAPPPVYATFERGQLRDAVLSHLQARPAEADPVTATEVAKALNAQTAPVATNLDRMTGKGLVTLVMTEPRRYVAA